MRIGGILLSGGKSSRMGRPKALLPFGTEVMLERVARLLSEVVEPLVVVGTLSGPGATAELQRQGLCRSLKAPVLWATDERPERGPLEGLRAGLKAIGDQADAVYATGCDVPLLEKRFVERMIAALGEHRIAVPVERQEGRTFHHPLAAVYRVDVLAEVEALLAADVLRPVALFDAVSTCRVPAEELRSVDPELNTFANLNRPEDYLAAIARAGSEPPGDFTT